MVTLETPRRLLAAGGPQRALVVQCEEFDAHPRVTILPIVSALRTAPLLRVTVTPQDRNTPLAPSQVMVDDVQSIRRRQIRMVYGHVDRSSLLAVDRALTLLLGIAR